MGFKDFNAEIETKFVSGNISGEFKNRNHTQDRTRDTDKNKDIYRHYRHIHVKALCGKGWIQSWTESLVMTQFVAINNWNMKSHAKSITFMTSHVIYNTRPSRLKLCLTAHVLTSVTLDRK